MRARTLAGRRLVAWAEKWSARGGSPPDHVVEWSVRDIEAEAGEEPGAERLIAFAKAVLAEMPRCTGCDFDHGFEDHAMAIWRPSNPDDKSGSIGRSGDTFRLHRAESRAVLPALDGEPLLEAAVERVESYDFTAKEESK